jgi:hypothetical protein
MISKRVERTEPGSFTDLAQYLVAAKEDGEKLDDLWIVNSVAGETINDLNMAIFEIEAQQGLNTKVKADKQYHLVVSFRDEKPSPEDLRDIERHFAKALGFEEHPRVVATHTNTDNYHMHVAYSRIHPKTYKSHWPEWDFPKRDKVCRAMEQKYGLKIDLGRDDKEQTSPLPQPARDMEAHTWEQSLAGYIQEHKQPLMAALGKANGWQDLHAAFGKYDLVLKKRGNGLIIGNRPTNQHTKAQHVKASSLDRSFSKAALEKRFGPYQAAERSIKPVKPVKRYERRPVTRHPHQSRLWRQYIGQRRSRDSLAVKAFKTWRDFLLYGIDDPLAMAIVMFHKKLIEAALGASPSAPKPSIPLKPAALTPLIDADTRDRGRSKDKDIER